MTFKPSSSKKVKLQAPKGPKSRPAPGLQALDASKAPSFSRLLLKAPSFPSRQASKLPSLQASNPSSFQASKPPSFQASKPSRVQRGNQKKNQFRNKIWSLTQKDAQLQPRSIQNELRSNQIKPKTKGKRHLELLTWRLKLEPYQGIEWSLDAPKWEPRSTQTEAQGQETPNQSPAASRSHIFFTRVGSGKPKYLAERDWYQKKARKRGIPLSTDTETKEAIISVSQSSTSCL